VTTDDTAPANSEPFRLGYARTDLRRSLVAAVLRGTKTATSSLRTEYAPYAAESLPCVGDTHLLLGSDDEPVGIVETTEVRTITVGEVDLAFAIDEGEAFISVDAWRSAHERFWAIDLTDDTPIVAQRFRLVARRDEET
jgi:uncharacterized protein YhfF